MFQDTEQAIQRRFPDFTITKSVAESAFIFINSEEHVEFITPTTPKIIRIPNIGDSKPKPLTGRIAEIVESPKTHAIVLFSFGSVLRACYMPAKAKTAFIEAFTEFPDVTFFWKYEKPEDGTAANVSNIVIDKWLPQRDLLHHPKIRAFITHGGQNSLNEAAAAGVPLIGVPAFADQHKNVKLLEYRGIGFGLNLKTITKEIIVEALEEILANDNYKTKAQLLSRMIKARPLSTKDLFIKHVEFAAEFGDTGTLTAEGANQSSIVLYSIDVIGFFLVVFIVFIFSAKWILLFLLSRAKSLLLKSKKE